MEDRYTEGTIVVDKEEENPEEAVVVRNTDVRITQWNVDNGEKTVHDDNPEYDEDELTTLVVFTDYLDEEWPEWRETDPEDLYEEVMDRDHIKWYSFPRTRLVPEQRYMPEEYATLNEKGKQKFGDMFEVERIPLGHIIDQRVKSENPDTEGEVEVSTFAMDYSKLLPKEKEKLKERLKEKFDEGEEEFQEHLSEMNHTVPIRSKFVTGATSQVPFRYM